MRKVVKKVFAGIMSVTLVASLMIGVNFTKNVKAADTVELPMWSFSQGGDYTLNGEQYEGGNGNVGVINSVELPDETLTGWLGTGDPDSVNQTMSATKASNEFTIDIKNTGWDCQWSAVTGLPENRINPWSIQANLHNIPVTPGYSYTVSFKAHATKAKLAYIAFGTDMEGKPAPYGDGNAPEGDQAIIQLTPTEKEYTYTFTNWVSAETINMDIMLGAFDAEYDFAGNLITEYVPEYAIETNWTGTVYINDFQIISNGLDSGFVPKPTPWIPETTTAAPNNNTPTGGSTIPTPNNNTSTVGTPQAPKKFAKVKNVKAKNNKKGTVTVTWKKVAKAKKYQVKVGSKNYTAKKTKLVVKKGLKKGKTYKVRVRAQAANGYKTGAWSKTVKVKIKK